MSEISFNNIDTAVDDRGYLRFCNSFDLTRYVRFYDVTNYQSNFIRAWHGHKKESKAAIVREGSAMICLVKIANKSYITEYIFEFIRELSIKFIYICL